MGLEISKRYSSYYGFHLVSAKFHEDIGYHGGIQSVSFLVSRPRCKKVEFLVANFNMRANGKIIKYVIYLKQLIVE